ncbi:MAG: adenine phosphoribosyltransferase [Bdellovibrio sp. CG12_big_fil_rev_8_21_14_0_65_39_13]|nr:MAG: adenine phosphoribosyltransferase [Bdellovibrio sp. CG22_combo_CG10-13_8_21_14_all_39_27]PIQ59462.1 MAG: adenine phosphoribosyltransferase [Bdellovibrio sp. CG12_big_fil_rev_8_21_14_0_65_39_13]PIR36592.1 MAG: adenine phosphoribosyltransferase [Bdellovibrio sp. CG11_big_fil_rev_8_21_14_0_20_39_38]
MPIKSKIRTIPHFPKEGIMFRDITTLLKDPPAFKQTIDLLADRYKDQKIDVIVGIEARGFILGAALAYAMGIGFVPIRKKGKLPGKTIAQNYELEYGVDTIEIHIDAIEKGQNCLLVDDLLATGGTILGAVELVEKTGGLVHECCFLVDLPEIGGSKKLNDRNLKWFALVDFEGH